jgi:hypothetical protein
MRAPEHATGGGSGVSRTQWVFAIIGLVVVLSMVLTTLRP